MLFAMPVMLLRFASVSSDATCCCYDISFRRHDAAGFAAFASAATQSDFRHACHDAATDIFAVLRYAAAPSYAGRAMTMPCR